MCDHEDMRSLSLATHSRWLLQKEPAAATVATSSSRAPRLPTQATLSLHSESTPHEPPKLRKAERNGAAAGTHARMHNVFYSAAVAAEPSLETVRVSAELVYL